MTTTAWYIIRSDATWAKWINVLHLPYLAWHLSYPAIGAALVPDPDLVLMGWIVLAFFLGMGVAGHCYDLLKGDPLRLGISRSVLHVAGATSLTLAMAIGVWQILAGDVSPWLLLSVPFGAVLAIGYGLELPGLHGDWQFAAWWGVFPLLVGYFTQDTSWIPALAPAILFAYLSADAQRTMSTRSRYLRRKTGDVMVQLNEETSHPGSYRRMIQDKNWLLLPTDRALRLLSFALPLIALTLILTR